MGHKKRKLGTQPQSVKDASPSERKTFQLDEFFAASWTQGAPLSLRPSSTGIIKVRTRSRPMLTKSLAAALLQPPKGTRK